MAPAPAAAADRTEVKNPESERENSQRRVR